MTIAQRITRLQGMGNSVRGVDRCADNARRSLDWGNESDALLWVDQGEAYAGIISAAEFNRLHS